MPDAVRTLTLDELAAEAGAPPALIERLVELGQLEADSDGRFDARDGAIISTVQALEGAGVTDDDLVWLVRQAGGGYRVIGRMFTTPAPGSGRHTASSTTSLGPLGARVPAVYAGFGLPEPQADRPMREDEVSIIGRFLAAWDSVDRGGDSDVRVARLTGETSRRLMEGWLDAWDAAAQPAIDTQGAPSGQGRPADPTDPDQNPSVSGAALVRELLAWIEERHLEQTLNQRIIDASENALVGSAGCPPARRSRPRSRSST